MKSSSVIKGGVIVCVILIAATLVSSLYTNRSSSPKPVSSVSFEEAQSPVTQKEKKEKKQKKEKKSKKSNGEATTVTEAETARPAPVYLGEDYDYAQTFENCAFIGNSRIEDFRNYGIAGHVFASVGLTVDKVFTSKSSGSSRVIIDELYGGSYDKVFIYLGDNECGWPNLDIFTERYKKVVDAVLDRQPSAQVYIVSILPISQHASSTNKNGCTNENIKAANAHLMQLAQEEGVTYLDVASHIMTGSGTLPDEAANDGIHLNKKYCTIWASYIVNYM